MPLGPLAVAALVIVLMIGGYAYASRRR